MDHVLQMLGCAPKSAAQPDGYRIAPSEDAAFFPGRQAEVFLKGQKVGILGIIHPQVLKAFGVGMPVTAMELNLEPFV